jgi:hypothetical protein
MVSGPKSTFEIHGKEIMVMAPHDEAHVIGHGLHMAGLR